MSPRAALLQELYYALAIPTLPRWTSEHLWTDEEQAWLEAHVKGLLTQLMSDAPGTPGSVTFTPEVPHG